MPLKPEQGLCSDGCTVPLSESYAASREDFISDFLPVILSPDLLARGKLREGSLRSERSSVSLRFTQDDNLLVAALLRCDHAPALGLPESLLFVPPRPLGADPALPCG